MRYALAHRLSSGLAIAYALVRKSYRVATHYAFVDHYTAGVLEAGQAAGVAPEALVPETRECDQLRVNHRNPLFRVPVTVTEILPVGIVVALVSAGLLRRAGFLPGRR